MWIWNVWIFACEIMWIFTCEIMWFSYMWNDLKVNMWIFTCEIIWMFIREYKFTCEFGNFVWLFFIIFRQQALTVLQESIRIAHESNDHICLAHGLRLLYRLKQVGEIQAKHILERFRARASELKLPVRLKWWTGDELDSRSYCWTL